MVVYILAQHIQHGEAKGENEYSRVVRYEGYHRALNAMNHVFDAFDVE